MSDAPAAASDTRWRGLVPFSRAAVVLALLGCLTAAWLALSGVPLTVLLVIGLVVSPLVWLATNGRHADLLHPWPLTMLFAFTLFGINLIQQWLDGSSSFDLIAPGVTLAFLGLTVGGAAARLLPEGQQREELPGSGSQLWFRVLTVFFAAVGVYYLYRAGGPAFLSSAPGTSRFATAQDIGATTLWVARGSILTGGVALALWAKRPSSRTAGVWAWGSVAWGAFFAFSTGWRLDLFIVGFLIIAVLRYSLKSSGRRLGLVMLLVPAYYFGFGLFRVVADGGTSANFFLSRSSNSIDLFLAVAAAQLSDFNRAYQFILVEVPSSIDFLWGRPVMVNLATLAPGYQPLFDDYLKGLFGGRFAGGFNPGLIGELYMSWGYPGILAGTVAIGALIARYYGRVKRNPVTQNVVAYGLALGIGGLAMAGGSIDLIFVVFFGALARVLYMVQGRLERPGLLELGLAILVIVAAGMETFVPGFWRLPWMIDPGQSGG